MNSIIDACWHSNLPSPFSANAGIWFVCNKIYYFAMKERSEKLCEVKEKRLSDSEIVYIVKPYILSCTTFVIEPNLGGHNILT